VAPARGGAPNQSFQFVVPQLLTFGTAKDAKILVLGCRRMQPMSMLIKTLRNQVVCDLVYLCAK
jgi:hypothetical protein